MRRIMNCVVVAKATRCCGSSPHVLKLAASRCPVSDQAQLFSGTARRIYGIW
ncbi:hypothetical protein FHX62_002727 [Cupriavidus alkaliphilus]|nr:hypothetical protein [Cupriavidus alkaliphilus]